jgi:peptide/nickel transport system ATP-binding protein
MSRPPAAAPLLSIRGLDVQLAMPRGSGRVLAGVDLDVDAGEAVGLVGESGCGKTLTALSVLRLLPARVLRAYPHELSGGMCQRAMIALALACRPALLIADEPTTALDVTVQLEILVLLRRLRETLDLALLLITHNLGLVAEVCHRVAVMYAGEIVEIAPVADLFSAAAHPYTRRLLEARPRIGAPPAGEPIPGSVPDPLARPIGCAFHPRCHRVQPRCRQAHPEPEATAARAVRCFYPEGASS